MSYLNSAINSSPTIAVVAGAAITDPAMLACTFDASGKAVVASTAGAAVVGIAPADADKVAAGDTLTLAIKDSVLWLAGEAITAGALLTTDANGKAAVAEAGDFIFARALSAAAAADDIVQAQIINAGYVPST